MKTELADEKKMNELVLKDQKEWRTKMEAIEKKHKDMEKTLNDVRFFFYYFLKWFLDES